MQLNFAGVTLKILFKSINIWIYKFLINLFPAQFPVSHTTNLEASKRGKKTRNTRHLILVTKG